MSLLWNVPIGEEGQTVELTGCRGNYSVYITIFIYRNMTVLTGYFWQLHAEFIMKIKIWILNKIINFYNVDPNNKSPLNAEAARLWNSEGK